MFTAVLPDWLIQSFRYAEGRQNWMAERTELLQYSPYNTFPLSNASKEQKKKQPALIISIQNRFRPHLTSTPSTS